MNSDPSHQKRALRAELRERRRNMTALEKDVATDGLTGHLIELVSGLNARSISCYLPTPNEPNTRPFLNWAQDHDIRVLFPISREDGLLDWTVGGPGAETDGLFGTPEPRGDLLGPIAINDVDLIIVPAASVGRDGLRMGWGRGYFDKTLGSMDRRPPVFAVIFDHELVDSVPRELHDQPVDGVVTPGGVIPF
ncbi:5-formyltetrahydrofolate cyclo-ligase [Homoserinimonas sp. OAct 916]|uniref:5-formyltetrahydrofolate cyclo-ligase n=1 Tax=Homoserinimonas sp. OAct 916 TaxID=2211450 RepID=UPI000DBE14DA|nr:5-formyltetrahydrofolate cyclo-ligase [Homoserinimonas sp. OAct 916]